MSKETLRLYHVREDYIEFLRGKDEKVLMNKQEKRVYVGVVLYLQNQEGTDVSYFAPLSSPKDKHKRMKNTKDFWKIDQGELGAINFNNMIPIGEKELLSFDIQMIRNDNYRELLKKQAKLLKNAKDELNVKAQDTYDIRTANYNTLNGHEKRIYDRCCDFSFLEKLLNEYQQLEEPTKEVAATKEKNGLKQINAIKKVSHQRDREKENNIDL